MVHIELPRPRPSSVINIDPAVTLGQDVAKLVIDWMHISRIKKIDELSVHLQGTAIDSEDLKQLLEALLMDMISEKAEIKVERKPVKYFCHEHHVTTHEKKCHVCGQNIIRELPKIHIQIKAKDKKAEIHI